jgi:hypothetical protein
LKYLLIILLVVVIVISVLEQSAWITIFAASPSYSRQVIGLPLDANNRPLTINIECDHHPKLPIAMELVTHNSDGKMLNATLWLKHCSYPKTIGIQDFTPYYRMLRYGMKVYVTDYSKASYDAYIQNENNTQWISTVIEDHPNNESEHRTLSMAPTLNPLEKKKNDDNYVHLSLNLNSIGSPESYKLLFYTAYKNGTIQDRTDRDLIPFPPHLNASLPYPSFPKSPINMKPNDSFSMPIHVNSTEIIRTYSRTFGEQIYLNISNAKYNGIGIRFSPNTVRIPPSGIATTNFTVNVPQNITMRGIMPIRLKNDAEYFSYGDSFLHYYIEPAFNLRIIDPTNPSIFEDIRDTLLHYYGITIFIPFIITTIVVLLIPRFTNFRMFRQLKEGVITAGDLLTVDGAVIAGVLILLTIQHTATSAQFTSGTIPISWSLLTGVTTASIIIPFGLSAIRTATHGLERRGIQLVNIGFIYLIVSVILLGVVASPQ